MTWALALLLKKFIEIDWWKAKSIPTKHIRVPICWGPQLKTFSLHNANIPFSPEKTKFIKKLMDNKLLTIRAAENVIRILPPLNVKKSEINKALKIIDKVCASLK